MAQAALKLDQGLLQVQTATTPHRGDPRLVKNSRECFQVERLPYPGMETLMVST